MPADSSLCRPPRSGRAREVVVGPARCGPDLVPGHRERLRHRAAAGDLREPRIPAGRAAPDFGVEPVELPGRSGRSRVLAHSPSRSPALPARGRGRPIAPASTRALRRGWATSKSGRTGWWRASSGWAPKGRRMPADSSLCRPPRSGRAREVVVGPARCGPDLVPGHRERLRHRAAAGDLREPRIPAGRAAPDFGVEPVELPGRSGRSRVLAHSPSRSPALPARGRGRPIAPASTRALRRGWATSKSGRTGRQRPPGGTGRDD